MTQPIDQGGEPMDAGGEPMDAGGEPMDRAAEPMGDGPVGIETDTEVALLIDEGSAWTKGALIGRVRGRWRLVAHAAQPGAWGAVELRRRLVEQLAASADPRLTERLDEIVARAPRITCHTARHPARLAVVAVSRELSASTARRAAEAAGWQVEEVVTFDDGRTLPERIATLQGLEVEAWLIAGGFDDGRSERALEAAALVAAARHPGSAPVVWAGSAMLAAEAISFFEPGGAVAVANPRPDARGDDTEPLRAHLDALLRRTVAPDEEQQLVSVALPRAVGALAATSGLRTIAVDIGATGAVRVTADAGGEIEARVHALGGLAGAARVPGAAGRVARMAADAGDEAAVADLLQVLRARPGSVPQSAEELAATHAAARLQLGLLFEDGAPGPADLLIGCGRTIASAPHPGQSFRMLLDGVRPIGVTQLALDAGGVLGPLGSLEAAEIREAVSLLADDLLVPLGTAVVCRGGEAGRAAMRVTVHRAGWPGHAPLELRTGQLQVIPLPRGQEAELTIEPADGVSLGAARRSPRITARATGGTVGLVLDARGVPIGLPRRGDDRRAVLASWRDTLLREVLAGSERVA